MEVNIGDDHHHLEVRQDRIQNILRNWNIFASSKWKNRGHKMSLKICSKAAELSRRGRHFRNSCARWYSASSFWINLYYLCSSRVCGGARFVCCDGCWNYWEQGQHLPGHIVTGVLFLLLVRMFGCSKRWENCPSRKPYSVCHAIQFGESATLRVLQHCKRAAHVLVTNSDGGTDRSNWRRTSSAWRRIRHLLL